MKVRMLITEALMTMVTDTIPKPKTLGDVTRPCINCAHYNRPSLIERVFFQAAKHECLHNDVRGLIVDPIYGLVSFGKPGDCVDARMLMGPCGPEGRLFLKATMEEQPSRRGAGLVD